MKRREFLQTLSTLAYLPGVATLAGAFSSRSGSPSRTESLEQTRRSMCDSLRTDPEMARDAIAFVDRWRGELGRIINIGSDLPS